MIQSTRNVTLFSWWNGYLSVTAIFDDGFIHCKVLLFSVQYRVCIRHFQFRKSTSNWISWMESLFFYRLKICSTPPPDKGVAIFYINISHMVEWHYCRPQWSRVQFGMRNKEKVRTKVLESGVEYMPSVLAQSSWSQITICKSKVNGISVRDQPLVNT